MSVKFKHLALAASTTVMVAMVASAPGRVTRCCGGRSRPPQAAARR